MKKIVQVVLSILMLLTVSAYSNENTTLPNGDVLLISDSMETLGGKPSVTIYFGENQNDFNTFTILKEKLHHGFSIDSRVNNTIGKVDLTSSYHKNKYYLNGKNNTFIVVQIKKLDRTNNKATIYIKARVSTADGDKYLNIDQDVHIIGKNFLNLVKEF